jgi:Pyridoxamine 5'-phosphate oxidase
MTDLNIIGPAFVTMAHRIVWCTVATTDTNNRPRTRVLHPIWEWDGSALTGWIATGPTSAKRKHLDANPHISLTYWDTSQDTCTADCAVSWDAEPAAKTTGWNRFATAPAPVGYDPSIIPGWTKPEDESFGILRLTPHRLRLMPGALMMTGQGELLTWSA